MIYLYSSVISILLAFILTLFAIILLPKSPHNLPHHLAVSSLSSHVVFLSRLSPILSLRITVYTPSDCLLGIYNVCLQSFYLSICQSVCPLSISLSSCKSNFYRCLHTLPSSLSTLRSSSLPNTLTTPPPHNLPLSPTHSLTRSSFSLHFLAPLPHHPIIL